MLLDVNYEVARLVVRLGSDTEETACSAMQCRTTAQNRAVIIVGIRVAFVFRFLSNQAQSPAMTVTVRSNIMTFRQQRIINLGNASYYLCNRVEVSVVFYLSKTPM